MKKLILTPVLTMLAAGTVMAVGSLSQPVVPKAAPNPPQQAQNAYVKPQAEANLLKMKWDHTKYYQNGAAIEAQDKQYDIFDVNGDTLYLNYTGNNVKDFAPKKQDDPFYYYKIISHTASGVAADTVYMLGCFMGHDTVTAPIREMFSTTGAKAIDYRSSPQKDPTWRWEVVESNDEVASKAGDNGYMQCKGSIGEVVGLIFPPVDVSKLKTPTLKFSVWGGREKDNTELRINSMGGGSSNGENRKKIWEAAQGTLQPGWNDISVDIRAASGTQDNVLQFQFCSTVWPKDSVGETYEISSMLDNISIVDAIEATAPGAPTLSVVKLQGTNSIKVTAPTLAVDSTALTGKMTVKLLRNGDLLASRDSVAPGESFTVVDELEWVPANEDMPQSPAHRAAPKGRMELLTTLYGYTAYCANENGEGLEAAFDAEAAEADMATEKVSNAYLVLTNRRDEVKIKHNKIKRYADRSSLTTDQQSAACYQHSDLDGRLLRIHDMAGSQSEYESGWVNKITTYTYFDVDAPEFKVVRVEPQMPGSWQPTAEPTYVIGCWVGHDTLQAPVRELFPATETTANDFTSSPQGNPKWRWETTANNDGVKSLPGDDGYLSCYGHEGEVVALVTPQISIEKLKKPMVRFYAWGDENDLNELTVYGAYNQTRAKLWQKAAGTALPKTGWNEITIDVSAAKGYKYASLQFLSEKARPSDTYTSPEISSVIDNISIIDAVSDNAPAAPELVAEFTNDSKVEANVKVTAPTKTVGGADLTGNVTLSLLRNGKNILPTVVTLAPGATTTIKDTFDKTGYKGYTAFCANDEGEGPETAIECDAVSAIMDAINEAENAVADVYNLQGQRVMKGATRDGMSNLPAGMYIHGTKKVIVK